MADDKRRVVNELGENYLCPIDSFASVALQRSTEGYGVAVPCLPCCWSQGKRARKAIADLQTAVRKYVPVAEGLPRGPPQRVRSQSGRGRA